eukprot:TRINITY_DN11_c0_g1_i1.p1 TRINITY_DN11_c0_g1~~TRINITY_DN11_c0_g1_i1.p1  ORF type:complete len:716 (+),score=77.67 TRINITY_DN11_c0_g1_i1:203-2350(+)
MGRQIDKNNIILPKTMKIIIFFFLGLLTLNAQNCTVAAEQKIDCGYDGITSQQCQAKGCCWVPVNETTVNIPWCFYQAGYSPCGTLNFSATSPGFTSADIAIFTQYFYDNIDIMNKGGVCASPSKTNPDYYYHWMRDGSLSMRAYMDINDFNYAAIQQKMSDYVQWVLTVQNEADPNNMDVRIEPKFFLPDGGVYTGGWCRPQNDGPSLRSTTLMYYAQVLFNNSQSSYVTSNLWTTGAYNGGAIKYDLDWVAQNFIGSNTCDLWEEVRNTEFFWNYYNARKAMLMGSEFATKMGDSTRASNYKNVAQQIEAKINSTFWTGSFIMEAANRQKDGAVICGLNKGYHDDNYIPPTDPKVTATIQTLNTAFCAEFDINQVATKAGIPGIFYGRYPGDSYQGGNPWILITAALGELFYRGATYTSQNGLPEDHAQKWRELLNLDESNSVEDIANAMVSAGDSVMYRIYHYVKSDNFHMAEQLSKVNGTQLSARDLTWSYANVLTALKARNATGGHNSTNHTNTTGTKYPGIDVSVWQGSIDWYAVGQSNLTFVIAQATNGLGIDSTFSTNWNSIKSTNLKPGAYHTFQPGVDATKQAQLFCNTVGSYQQSYVPPIISLDANGGQSASTLQANVLTWLNYVQSNLGVTPMIYTSTNFANNYLNSQFSAYPLYLAWYSSTTPTIPTAWASAGKSWTYWQYSQTGNIQGITGDANLDYSTQN